MNTEFMHVARGSHRAFLRRWTAAFFFLSGFTSLVYQVVWLRLAFSYFGIITPVLSVVVSVFMLGLSTGSWLSGDWIDRASHRLRLSPIYFYALSKVLTGLSAWAVPISFSIGAQWLWSSGATNSVLYLLFSAGVLGLSLLPWCFLMGTTFPLMAAFLQEQDRSDTTTFSYLYSANLAGALAGTLASACILVELFGFRHTLWVAGTTDFLIAALSVVIGWSTMRWPVAGGSEVPLHPPPEITETPATEPLAYRRAILFTTGLISMGLEVAWTRAFTLTLKTTIYAFAFILSVYLLSSWFGSLLYRRRIRNAFSTPDLLAGLAISAFLPIVLTDPRLRLGPFGIFLGIAPFCALLGYLTPKLIDEDSRGRPGRMGSAYAVNVMGCILGPLLTSYLLLPVVGLKGAMLLFALPPALYALAFCRRMSRPWRVVAGTACIGLMMCSSIMSQTYEECIKPSWVRRDYAATVTAFGIGLQKRLVVNGVGMTYLTTSSKAMAHLPVLFFPGTPRAALVICFGMGTTYRSLLSYEIPTTAVELVPSVVRVFPYFYQDATRLTRSPLSHIVIDDGRRFLERTQTTFDVVTLDPPPPVEAAGSSLLYSIEFYRAMKRHLSAKGVLQQWVPGGVEDRTLKAITRSLIESFPYVRVYKSMHEGEGFHFLASMHPLCAPSAAVWRTKLPPAAQQDLLEWEPQLDLTKLYQALLAQKRDPREWIVRDPGIRITDDRPYNEYFLLRRARALLNHTYLKVY
jgi:spermidine synthase/MFS family permease